jgi:glycolate oxidase
MTMNEILQKLTAIVGKKYVFVGDDISEEYTHDESLTVKPSVPEIVVKPKSAEEVAEILKLANAKNIPVTPRGGGTGLSGGCVPVFGGVLLSKLASF